MTKLISTLSALCMLIGAPSAAAAATVTVDAISSTGTTEAFGPVDPTESLIISASGIAYEQSPPSYGTNPAGVVVVAGSSPIGAATTFTTGGDGTYGAGTYDFGSLLATLTAGSYTKTVQIFGADAANGLGSGSPTQSLTYTGTFGDLFGAFADAPNATVNFVVADNLYTDNAGGFSVSTSAAPEPAAWSMMLLGVAIAGSALRVARRNNVKAIFAS